MALILATMALAIYPEGHFEHVTKCSQNMFEGFVKREVDAGRTLFVRCEPNPHSTW